MERKKTVKNLLLCALVILPAFALSLLFERVDVQEHITTIFVFAVFLISRLTDGYVYGVVSAVVATLAVNYAFTYPYFTLSLTVPENLLSAAIMVTVAVLTGMLTTKIKLHEAEKAESERERMRANLLRAVSHDLRTPLTTIYSASSMLRETREKLSVQQQDELLGSMQENSLWLVRMVENLLSVTRLDGIRLTKTPTILDELVDSALTKFLARYPAQRVTLALPDEPVVLLVDTILIEQVLINLLENAVLHAEGMTQLTLRVYTHAPWAVFELVDDGCGIREERLRQLFTGSYVPQHAPADGRKRSLGIGLSVCATIVKAHGGEISAENRKEGGALFRFSLETEAMEA